MAYGRAHAPSSGSARPKSFADEDHASVAGEDDTLAVSTMSTFEVGRVCYYTLNSATLQNADATLNEGVRGEEASPRQIPLDNHKGLLYYFTLPLLFVSTSHADAVAPPLLPVSPASGADCLLPREREIVHRTAPRSSQQAWQRRRKRGASGHQRVPPPARGTAAAVELDATGAGGDSRQTRVYVSWRLWRKLGAKHERRVERPHLRLRCSHPALAGTSVRGCTFFFWLCQSSCLGEIEPRIF